MHRLDALTSEGRKDRLVADDDQRGLYVRVVASGSKTFLAQYVMSGRKRRVPLGSCSAVSLKAARSATAAILGQVAQGIDVADVRKKDAGTAKEAAQRAAYTVDKLIDDWASRRLRDRRESYRTEACRALRKAFALHLKKPAADLDRAKIMSVLDELSDAGSVAMAHQVQRYGRAAFTFAAQRGDVPANPFAALPPPPDVRSKSRERVLSDIELSAIWHASGNDRFGRIVRVLMLTGQRREEVGGMRWDELSEGLSTWTLPGTRTKNGREHVLILSESVQEIIRGSLKHGDYVFGLRSPFSGFSRCKAALDHASGVTAWRIHDLRRTVATGLQRMGIRLEVTEAVLNHIAGSRAGIVGVYQKHDYREEKRVALGAWSAHVVNLTEGEADANVVKLRIV